MKQRFPERIILTFGLSSHYSSWCRRILKRTDLSSFIFVPDEKPQWHTWQNTSSAAIHHRKRKKKKFFESLIFFSSSKSVFNFTPLWINSSYQCVHYTTLLSLSVTKEKEVASRKLSLRNMSVYELYCHIYVFLFRGLLFYNRAIHFKQGCHRKVW